MSGGPWDGLTLGTEYVGPLEVIRVQHRVFLMRLFFQQKLHSGEFLVDY